MLWPGAGPFLFPAAPDMPVPEFCTLGALLTPAELLGAPGRPGGVAAAPGLVWSPTYPDSPELRVFTPLSASTLLVLGDQQTLIAVRPRFPKARGESERSAIAGLSSAVSSKHGGAQIKQWRAATALSFSRFSIAAGEILKFSLP